MQVRPHFSGAVQTRTAIGVDIGGTKLSSALYQQGEEAPHDFQETPTPKMGADFIKAIADMINTLKTKIAAENSESPNPVVGIATAGIVDTEQGKILGSTGNLPALQELPNFRQDLEAATGLKVYFENDANAAAYGEARAGAAQGEDNVLMITLGTGVGGGMVRDGKVYHGRNFSAGEVGHIAISMNNDRHCTCGKMDCWEAYASGTGVRETARRMLEQAPEADRANILGTDPVESVTTHRVVAALEKDDPLAKMIMDEWHKHIAVGLGSLVNVLDPGVVVVGGGMAKFVDFAQLTELTRKRAMMPDKVKLVPAQLGNNAGIVGAAYLALENLE